MDIKKVKLNLVGCDGNSFAVLGAFKKAAREQGWRYDEITRVTEEAMSGDRDHLLSTILSHVE